MMRRHQTHFRYHAQRSYSGPGLSERIKRLREIISRPFEILRAGSARRLDEKKRQAKERLYQTIRQDRREKILQQ
jgi:hypothetical protein